MDLNEKDLIYMENKLKEVKRYLEYGRASLPKPPEIVTEEEMKNIQNMLRKILQHLLLQRLLPKHLKQQEMKSRSFREEHQHCMLL